MFDDTKLKKMTLKHSEQKTELDHSHVSDDPPPLAGSFLLWSIQYVKLIPHSHSNKALLQKKVVLDPIRLLEALLLPAEPVRSTSLKKCRVAGRAAVYHLPFFSWTGLTTRWSSSLLMYGWCSTVLLNSYVILFRHFKFGVVEVVLVVPILVI